MSVKMRFFTLLVVLTLLSALAACSGEDKKEKKKAEKAVPIKVVKVEPHDVPVNGQYVGQVAATKTVDIKARVEGYLQEWTFKEGQLVSEGETLFLIDPRPYKEALKQAEAELARSKATLNKAATDYVRFKTLLEQGAVSREEFDTKSTDKQVLEAQLNNAKAAVEKARLDLGYTTIKAPMDGIIGRTNVNIGDLVSSETLARISSIDPVYVNFSIPEREYLIAMREMEKKKKSGNAESAQLKIILADGSYYPHNGTFNMADRAVDSSTGTLGIRAVFPNPDHILRDGQYAKVVAKLKTFKDALTVPSRAVLDIQGSKSLLLVNSNGTVVEKPVKISYSDDKISIIEKGLEKGDLIIADGVKKIRPGTLVKPTIVDDPDAARESGVGDSSQ